MNKKTFSLFLAIAFLSSIIVGLTINVHAVDYPAHDPIIIEGNSDFTSGNGVINPEAAGTADDPFIIEELKISSSGDYGGYLDIASAIKITNTTKHFVIRDCRIQPFMESGFGVSSIILDNVKNGNFQNIIISKGILSITINEISDTNVSNCKFDVLQSSSSSNNIFYHCDLSQVYLLDSSNHNNFSYCQFKNFSMFGLLSRGCSIIVDENSTENIFHHNNFYVYEADNSAVQTANNIWYDTSTNEGNWWSDYAGSDNNDGVGESPYDVPWTGAEDQYPLVDKIESAGIGGGVIEADFSFFPYVQVDQPVNFTDTSTGNITSWSWDFGDGHHSYKTNPSHTYTEPGNYTVELTVTGEGGTDSESAYVNVTAEQQWTNKKPVVTIANPSSGTSVTKGETVIINGTAYDPDFFGIKSVQVQIAGEWRNATFNSTSSQWSYQWDTSNVIPRNYKNIKARAYDLDGNINSTSTISITVESAGGGNGGTPGFEAIVVFIAMLAAVLLYRRRHWIK